VDVGSPQIKLLYDVYHQQITEGSIIETMTECLEMIEIQAHTSVFRRRSSDTQFGCHRRVTSVALVGTHYGFGEMPSPNHKGWRTSGGSHGDDTESDGASLAGPQPYEGDKREFPRRVAGSLRVRVGTEERRLPESDGRIPRLQAREEVNGHIHIADVPGPHDPGTSELNYPTILDALATAGHSGFNSCEFFPSGDAEQALSKIVDIIGLSTS
jgi:hypothetical protein